MPTSPHGGEDWRKRLRNASFKGAHFWVDTDGIDGGRRIVIHEFPLSERPYNEDMGQQARRYKVDAYCVGGQAAREATRLIAACTTPGPGTLVLPLFGGMLARCIGISSKREKDKHGFVAFQLDFVADTLSLGAMGGSPHMASRVKQAAGDVPPALLEAVQGTFDAFQGVGHTPLPTWVLDSSVAAVESFATFMSVIIEQSGLRGSVAAKLARDVQDMYDHASEWVLIGDRGDIFGFTHFMSASAYGSAEPLVNAVTTLLDDYRQATEPSVALRQLAGLAEFDPALESIPETTETRKIEKQNQETLLSLFRRSALSEYAQAIPDYPFKTRQEAVAMRAEVAVRFGAEINRITDPKEWEVYQALHKLLGLTVEFLTQRMTSLAPIVVVEAKRLMPSLYWSYRLYGDALRSEELWERNDIKHPAWMPTEFEALAR